MNSTTLGRIKVGGICRFGSFGLSLSPREEVVSKNLLFLKFDEGLVFLLLVDDSFISRLATGTYTLGGMYVPMYTCTRRSWIEIGRCLCSDVMDWD